MSHGKHPYGSGRDWEMHLVEGIPKFQTVWDSGGTDPQALEDNFNQLVFASGADCLEIGHGVLWGGQAWHFEAHMLNLLCGLLAFRPHHTVMCSGADCP